MRACFFVVLVSQTTVRIFLRVSTQLDIICLFGIPGKQSESDSSLVGVCMRPTHQINYADVIPALHYRKKRDKHGDDPAASQH